MTQGGGVPSWHRGAPSLRGVEPSLSSCGILPPLPKHPLTQTASKTVTISFTVSPLRRRAFSKRQQHARRRVFGIVVQADSARQAKSYSHEYQRS
jgi:hypothetical protein